MTAIQTPIATIAHDGFAWGDAMLGAGSTLGIVLLGGAAVLTIRRRGRMLSH